MSDVNPHSGDRKASVHRCVDCNWWTGLDEGRSGNDSQKRAIQHHVDTAHTVVLRSAGDREEITSRPNTTRARPRWLGSTRRSSMASSAREENG